MYKIIFFFMLGCGITSVISAPKKVSRALDDFACTTQAVNPLFKIFMRGRPDLNIPGSDPVHVGVVSAQVEEMNYNLTDAELYGLSNCVFKQHNINVQQLSWNAVLHCPQLVIKSNYVMTGAIGGNPIAGNGRSNIVHDKYRVGMHGGFKFVVDSQGRPHLRITAFDLDRLEVEGNIKSQFSNLYNGDPVKSQTMHKYLDDNWKTISFYSQYSMMRSFFNQMMDNVNIFLRVVPVNDLYLIDQ